MISIILIPCIFNYLLRMEFKTTFHTFDPEFHQGYYRSVGVHGSRREDAPHHERNETDTSVRPELQFLSKGVFYWLSEQILSIHPKGN
jgi:hypothetical protein